MKTEVFNALDINKLVSEIGKVMKLGGVQKWNQYEINFEIIQKMQQVWLICAIFSIVC